MLESQGSRAPVPKPRRERGLGPRARSIAHAWGLIAIAVFAALAATLGLPRSLEGGLLNHTLEARAQYVFFGVTVVGMLVAWVRPMLGGSIAAVSAVGLGVLAGVQYRPQVALLVCLAFFVPAAIEIALCMREKRRSLWALPGIALTALLALGGVGAFQIHAATFGPSHPGSSLQEIDSDTVEWVWSGAVSESGATVKAKIDGGTDVRLALTRPGESATIYVRPARAHPWPGDVATFVASGLEPATDYRYVVEVDGRPEPARQGRFATFAEGAHSFTVAVGSCARVGSNGQVFEAIREAEPSLYVIAGDFFYANIGENDPDRYRSQFTEALTRPAQAALYQDVPVAYVWDDHDYGPNDGDRTSPSRDAARAAYRESVPHYPLAAGPGNEAIYQTFTRGRVRFLLTDTRSERDPATQDGVATRSMLGSAQKAWLKKELLAANGKYPVIAWVNSVPWIGEPDASGDYWNGFAEERAELADFIADNEIAGVVMISGDAHMVAIDDGTNSDYSTSRSGGFPILHAAALDRRGSVKGGPYSEGAFPGSGQFGLFSVEDDGGDTVTVSLSGLNWRGEEIVGHRVELPARVEVADGDR